MIERTRGPYDIKSGSPKSMSIGASASNAISEGRVKKCGQLQWESVGESDAIYALRCEDKALGWSKRLKSN